MQFVKITMVLSAVNVEDLYFTDLERPGIKCKCFVAHRYEGKVKFRNRIIRLVNLNTVE